MKSIYYLFLFSLVVSSCERSEKVDSVLENELIRIESSLYSSISDKLHSIQVEYELSPEKWFVAFEKTKYIMSVTDSLLQEIHSEDNITREVISLINRFSNGVKLLQLNNEGFELIRNQRLDYWKTNSFEESQRYALAIDLRLCFSEIVDELFDQVNSKSYTFNTLRPIILESTNVVSVDETYVAKIGLLAYDSTSVPVVMMDEYYLEVEGGYGIYRASSSKPGIKKFGGSIILMRNDHNLDTLFYNATYRVK